MWIVEIEDQGYSSYEIYKNKPIIKEEFPTERTCEAAVENYEQAEYLATVDEEFVNSIFPFTLNSGEPVEFDINVLGNPEDKVVNNEEPGFYHYNIKLYGDADPDKIIVGKKLKDIAVYNGFSESENSLLLLFDDNTYVNIGLDYNDDNEVWRFKNNFEYLVDTIKGKAEIEKNPLNYGYIGSDGNYHVNSKYENYVKLGIIKYSDEAVKLAVKRDECVRDQKDYAEYLRLKAKFEGIESVKKLKYTV